MRHILLVDGNKMENTNMRLIMQLANVIIRNRNAMAAKFGLTSSQMDIMYFLIRTRTWKEVTQRDIQQAMLLTHQTVTGVLARLEEKGFIVCRRSERDKRCKCITVTEKALCLKDALTELAGKVEKKLAMHMTPQQVVAFNTALEIALKNMRAWNEQGEK